MAVKKTLWTTYYIVRAFVVVALILAVDYVFYGGIYLVLCEIGRFLTSK